MAGQRAEQPAYQFHVSGQARVILAGKDFYLGKHGTPESYARYYALLAEYNSNGKEAPAGVTHFAEVKIRIRDITADFRQRVLPRYEFNESMTNRFSNVCNLLDEGHGDESPEDFGPLKLEGLRDHFVESGNSRKYANNQTRLVVRIIKHGVSRELVSAQRIVALEALEPLRPGEARETTPKGGVDAASINLNALVDEPSTNRIFRLIDTSVERFTVLNQGTKFTMSRRRHMDWLQLVRSGHASQFSSIVLVGLSFHIGPLPGFFVRGTDDGLDFHTLR